MNDRTRDTTIILTNEVQEHKQIGIKTKQKDTSNRNQDTEAEIRLKLREKSWTEVTRINQVKTRLMSSKPNIKPKESPNNY